MVHLILPDTLPISWKPKLSIQNFIVKDETYFYPHTLYPSNGHIHILDYIQSRCTVFDLRVKSCSLSIQDKAVVVGRCPILIAIHPFLIAEEVFHLASYSSKITKPYIFETAILFQPFVTFEEQHLVINSKTLRFPGGLCF